MSFGKKLKELRTLHNLTQGQLAYKMGVTTGTIAHWESGRRKPDYDAIAKLSEMLDVTVDYLVGVTTIPNGEVITKLNIMKTTVQVFGRIPAGTPFEAIEDVIDEMYIPDELIKKKDRLFGLLIDGDSMNKIVPDGAYGLFLKQDTLENGEIGAILVNGYDATVKRFYRLTDSVLLEPVSSNQEHQPLIIRDSEQPVSIIGKLVWYSAPKIFK